MLDQDAMQPPYMQKMIHLTGNLLLEVKLTKNCLKQA